MNWHEYFTYDGEASALRWSHGRRRSSFRSDGSYAMFMSRDAGKLAGTTSRGGYVQVCVNYALYLAHRIIWEMHHGPIPDGMQIDHINGVRDDNRIENLRLASSGENTRNSKKRKDNTSGFKGVSLCNRTGRWRARIYLDGIETALGYFDSREEAYGAYCTAASNMHREFMRLG